MPALLIGFDRRLAVHIELRGFASGIRPLLNLKENPR